MNWIREFARSKPKPPDYAEKTLAAYRLGIKAGGSIQGVRVLVGDDSCPACAALAQTVYLPDDAPRLPLASCTHPRGCRCAYAPVMKRDPGLTPAGRRAPLNAESAASAPGRSEERGTE